MSGGFTVRHDLVNHTIMILGADFGQKQRAIPIHWLSPDGKAVVIKIPGRAIRLDQLHSGYAPARFLVMQLERDDGGVMRAEQVAWFPILKGAW